MERNRYTSSVCISSLVVWFCISSLLENLISGVNSSKEKATSSYEMQVKDTSPPKNLQYRTTQDTRGRSTTLVHALEGKLKIKDMPRYTSKCKGLAVYKFQCQYNETIIPLTASASLRAGIREIHRSGNRRKSDSSMRGTRCVHQPLVNSTSLFETGILKTGSIRKKRNSIAKILQPYLDSTHKTDRQLMEKQTTPAGNGCGSSSAERKRNEEEGRLEQRLPQAIVIGVKKCGTRALLEFLRSHPDVRAAGPETHFFDRNYGRGLDWYRRQMPLSTAGQVTVEKTPSYFITEDAPQRIFNMSTEVRLIVVVRDPVTRAISDYVQAVSKRPRLPSFIDLAFRNASRSRSGLAMQRVKSSWASIQLGIYGRHMKRWLGVFPRHQIHVVDGERLIEDPFAEVAKVQDFLQLRPAITRDQFYFSRSKGFPCLVVDSDGRSQERMGIRCLGRSKGRRHPRIDAQYLRELREFYRPFNEDFFRMIGTRFDW